MGKWFLWPWKGKKLRSNVWETIRCPFSELSLLFRSKQTFKMLHKSRWNVMVYITLTIMTFRSVFKVIWRSGRFFLDWTLCPDTFFLQTSGCGLLSPPPPKHTQTVKIIGQSLFVSFVSQTFDLNFVPFQDHKNLPQIILDVKFPALFKSAVKNRGSHLIKGSYLKLTLKIDLKVKKDIWDYILKWVTVYVIINIIIINM